VPQYKTILTISLILVLLGEFAAILGIFSLGGPGRKEIRTYRNTTVELYGTGIYKDMPADVAPQGIAQDYVTLFLGIPFLLFALIRAQDETIRSRLLLAGTLAYFMITYMFWLTMCTFNDLYPVYVILAGLSMTAFLLVMLHLPPKKVKAAFTDYIPRKTAGWFLILDAIMVAGMWLAMIIPPWVRGHYPPELYHFTTLIVQGLDLAYFLPFAFLSGYLLLKKSPWGYLFAPIYLVFLFMMMTALLAKMVYMQITGAAVGIPQYVFISAILLGALYLCIRVLQGVHR